MSYSKEKDSALDFSNNLKPCDPQVAKTFSEFYQSILKKHKENLSVQEREVQAHIQELFSDSNEIQKRELDGAMGKVHDVMAAISNSESTKDQVAFIKKLEEIVLLKFYSNKASELDSIDQFIESLLTLNYPNKLPSFEVVKSKRNILNYIGLSLESISEKFKGSTVSSKAVNNILRYLPESTIIVTDTNWNIRFVGTGGENYFTDDHTSMIGENLCSYIPGFSVISPMFSSFDEEYELAVNIKNSLDSNELSVCRLTFIPNKVESYSNGEQDEVEEVIFKLERINHSEPLNSLKKNNPLDLAIKNLEILLEDDESLTNSCSSVLNELKAKKKQKLDTKIAASAKQASEKNTLIDINSLVRKIANDMELVIGFSEITLILENHKLLPFYSDSNKVYGLLRQLITTLIGYRKIYSGVSEICLIFKDSETGTTIQVKDNGIGIPQSWVNYIFDLDFNPNAPSAITKNYNSGMHHVKQLIGELEGTITLVSKPNIGSSFKLELPPHK